MSNIWYIMCSSLINLVHLRLDQPRRILMRTAWMSGFSEILMDTYEKHNMKYYLELDHMSLVVRNPVFGVSDQVPHKPGCTTTEDS